MSDKSRERLAEYLLYETKEGADITQLENMTGLSRKIISVLNNFKRPYQDSPDAASIMEYLKKETDINDEEIILNNILNILKYWRNDTAVGKYGTEKKTLVNMEIYNYCTTIVKGYENLLENNLNTQEKIADTFENTNQYKIEFPEEK